MNVETSANQSDTQHSTKKEIEVKKRKFVSPIWKHFELVVIGGEEKVVCNYSHAKLLDESKQGTSHLRKHFNSCPQRTTRDIKQCLLKTEKQRKDKLLVGSYIFNQDASRMKLAKMIILHEYPL
ncbi:putative transcription factor/ chromatin remodeling BED-type(Zn) family [Lupinus albus]|uniref:Putative transcription factor/ chromatin remodeling BED-type(Zn) family n=1 Tax=Lupinus albus TaxID=3870 RepID=A0A6A4PVG9_LUPAL|nr:putative transcription factor/ chromatin remodeling BED-type(Zn) family [Lupinus albus]